MSHRPAAYFEIRVKAIALIQSQLPIGARLPSGQGDENGVEASAAARSGWRCPFS